MHISWNILHKLTMKRKSTEYTDSWEQKVPVIREIAFALGLRIMIYKRAQKTGGVKEIMVGGYRTTPRSAPEKEKRVRYLDDKRRKAGD